MNYVFFGTSEFGRAVLEKLLEVNLFPIALVTNPDKPVGRKQVLTYPPTKQLIFDKKLDTKIAILQPPKIDDVFLQTLQDFKADVFIIAAYAKIVPQSLLSIPYKGTIGVHPSLLPKYRGASPIQSVILNGETETGTSLFLVGVGMDDGPIIASRSVSIDLYDTTETLTKKLAEASGTLLFETLPDFLSGILQLTPQDDTQATFTKKFKTEDAFVDFLELQRAQAGDKELARSINQKIRAFYPEPGAYTLENRRRLKLLGSKVMDGRLFLTRIQYEGERPRTVRS